MKTFNMKSLHEKLFSMQDTKYRDFSAALMPTVDKETVIGIRTPLLRAFAKEYAKTEESAEFLASLPHLYYEENNLHAFLLERIKDYDKAVSGLDRFLPYVNNWATCDTMNPKVLGKYPERLIVKVKAWISDERTYVKRYGIGMLMRYFLDENFKTEYLDLVAAIRSNEYYVNMMSAWFFATALAKQYKMTISYMEEQRLDIWTHNKAIQKSIESFRVSDAHKAYLKTLKK